MGQKAIVMIWWEFGVSFASRNHLTTFYYFNDNLATGGSLTGAMLLCHVEL